MGEELGFRTPAKELERLRKRLEQIEGVSRHITDAVVLSVWALAWLHSVEARENPENARKLKDTVLDALKEAKISRELVDTLDSLCRTTCELLEEETA